MMDLQKMRERIHYKGAFTPTYQVLNDLQKQFLLHVPFENLDIHLGIPIDYSYKRVFHKIVERKRGGVCYENNTLFYEILKHIGFQVNFISAEMYKGLPLKNDSNHMHMALLVHIDEEIYLVDVGNGKSFGSPIPIIKKGYSKGEDSDYKVDDFQDIKALYFKDSNGKCTPRYVFDLFPKEREDFKEACVYIETSPESIFRKNTLASLYQEDGRITISGENFIRRKGFNTSTTVIPSKEEFASLLKTHFGMLLKEKQLDTLTLKSSGVLF